jgi:hypothetical protein
MMYELRRQLIARNMIRPGRINPQQGNVYRRLTKQELWDQGYVIASRIRAGAMSLHELFIPEDM